MFDKIWGAPKGCFDDKAMDNKKLKSSDLSFKLGHKF